MKNAENHHRLLVAGAAGYVGGRLLTALQAAKHEVRCLARRPDYLISRIKSSTAVVG